jgi:hypothetical protein
MAQITINEGLAWLKTLKKRHEELLALRNDNAHASAVSTALPPTRKSSKNRSTTSRSSTSL